LAPVSYLEAKSYFAAIDISQYRADLHVADAPGGCCGCLAPRLDAGLAADREAMFAMAKIQLDDDDPMHLRVLHTVYMRLMGGTRAMPRWGGARVTTRPRRSIGGCFSFGILCLSLCLSTSPVSLSLSPSPLFPRRASLHIYTRLSRYASRSL